MIGYNNQGIKLLPYNTRIPLCDKHNYALRKPPMIDHAWPSMACLRIEAWANFGLPDIFKREGLVMRSP